MVDPLHSLHLEGQPRREEFRAARRLLQESCGEQTVLGNASDLPLSIPLDGDTVVAPAAAHCLYFLDDGHTKHQLSYGINTVGRMKDNDVVIQDEHVSRKHCAIVVHSNGLIEVYDVASKNGTIVNGVKISGPTQLRHGSTLMLCTRKLKFLVESVKDPLEGLFE